MQISNLLNLSKVTIYKRLKSKELEPYKNKRHGVTYVSEEGFQLIKKFLDDPKDLNNIKSNSNSIKNDIDGDNQPSDYISSDKEDLTLNENMIKTLINQLKVKDLQLSEKDVQLDHKDIQIGELHNLTENSQVLLKEKPHQDVLQLEEHFQELDDKLIEIKDKMQKKDLDRRGIFRKIFKK